ncbi:MAG: glucose-6-phosphate dehydrogenase [Firmicutes bacterium]|jgi:glucose-6-phosphate 1-dehydrogenase|nr:glucose-6-phosphate dehydrogenase [Bacillota bacterium]
MRVQPCVLVIFGATGDLTQRKLYPALYNLWREELLPSHFAVVSIGRRDKTTAEVREDIIEAIRNFSRNDDHAFIDMKPFLELFTYYKLDFNDSLGYGPLKEYLAQIDRTHHTQGNRVYFLAVAPQYFALIADELHAQGMAENTGSWQRVVIEKPFGQDLASAIQLNRGVRETFREENIFRIDHYLGKEMAQNIMVIRFANTLFEPLWNNRYVDHVQISLCETVGVEGRGPYYEKAGALRDMIQNHVLQLLALIAMEPPVSLDTESVRDEKVKILRSLKVKPQDVVRGQYGPDKHGRCRGYREEDRVSPNSNTDTFVALKATIDNFRWAGVPFYLRTGKRLPQKYSEIVISFKKLPGVLYFKERDLASNLLVIRVNPDEGVYLQFNAKQPGTQSTILPVSMDFCQNCAEGFNSPEAYERLLYDVMRGDSTLFTRWDEVEYSWRFVDQIAEWWENSHEPIPIYPAGSWGPKESAELLKRDGRDWLRFTRVGGGF